MKSASTSASDLADAPAQVDAIVIGGSAGAVAALNAILPRLTRECPPVFVVVHLPADAKSLLAEIFATKCSVSVAEAVDKAPATAGAIIVAPPGYHLLVESDGCCALSIDERVKNARPSIDVLFTSAADAFGGGVIAVLLTGANDDGADGLAAVRAAGGYAVVQDPEEAEASAMPKSAIARGAANAVLPLSDIGVFLATRRPRLRPSARSA